MAVGVVVGVAVLDAGLWGGSGGPATRADPTADDERVPTGVDPAAEGGVRAAAGGPIIVAGVVGGPGSAAGAAAGGRVGLVRLTVC